MIKKFTLFCIVGATAAIVDLGVFNLLFYYNIYFVLCRVLAIGAAWIYVVIYLVAMLTNVLISYSVVNLLGENTLNGNIASISGIVFVIPITFFGSMLWVFQNKIHN
jgi:putative flippase GtrA